MYTIFSASNYSDGANDAAVLQFTDIHKRAEVYRFRTSEPPSQNKVAQKNRVKITELLCRRHHRLLRAFQKVDSAGTGLVSLDDWVATMTDVLRLKLNWPSIQPQLCPSVDGKINYNDFLDDYSMAKLGKVEVSGMVRPALSSLYDHFPMLKAVFCKWDQNHDGKVSYDEFIKGVKVLNDHIEDHHSAYTDPLDAEALLAVIDIDKSGHIEFDEFCECFRLMTHSI